MPTLLLTPCDIQAVLQAIDTVEQLQHTDELYVKNSDLVLSERRAAIEDVKEFGQFLMDLFDRQGTAHRRALLKMTFTDDCIQAEMEIPSGAIDNLAHALEVIGLEEDESLEGLYRLIEHGWVDDER